MQPYLSVQSKLFQEKSKPLQESKSTFIWWKVKERRVNIEILSNQIKPNSGKDTMLCFQISVFSLIFEGCVMRNFSLFIYINIFIYINNEKLRITQPSKIKLKTEIWKQSIVSLPELGLIWFDNISIFTRLSLTFHQMNVDLLSWSGLLFSWKSLLCTDKYGCNLQFLSLQIVFFHRFK